MAKHSESFILASVFLISLSLQVAAFYVYAERLEIIFGRSTIIPLIGGYGSVIISFTLTVICATIFSDKPKEKNYIYTNHGKVEVY